MSSIVLLQSDPAVGMGLCRAIEAEPGLRVGGIVQSLAQVRGTLEQVETDLLVADLHVADGRLTDLLRDQMHRVVEKRPQVLVLAMSVDDPHLMQALRHGAQGYFIHGGPLKSVAQAVCQVLAGESPMSPSIARRLKSHFTRPGGRGIDPDRQGPNSHTLTETDRQVLNRVSQGYLMHEIAREMHTTVHGVGLRFRSLYQKLQSSMHAEAPLRQAA